MIYLSVEGLCKEVPDKILFQNLKFGIQRGEKIGLIANNGTGKSSLLKILAGKEVPDAGKVYVNEDILIGYLEQTPAFDHDMYISELIEGSHTDIQAIIRNYEKVLQAYSDNYSEQTQKLFDEASTQMDQHQAWDYDRRLKQLLTRFQITDLEQKVNSLSGGQKKRLAMAMALLDNPDLLILDEPTNHLDIEMIEWLEKYLSQSNISLLMVTHDRYFLDRICNHILELHNGKLYHHKGNYGYFLEKRAEREAVLQSEIGKANKQMKKELEWMRRSPKARTTKSKSRVNAFYDLKDKANTKIQQDELQLSVKMSRLGGKILELKKVHKKYGDQVILDSFTHTFKKGERIGIVGKNGAGKSTFLNTLTGTITPDSGKVNIGDNTIFGYYTQGGLNLKEDKRIIDVLKDIAEVITLGNGKKLNASQFLEYFLFPVKMQRTFYSKLSGGEQRRLYLLTVLMKNPNFLILDEPTNDLDLLTLNKLEEFLENYPGCLVLVSHDRYFMDTLVDQLFIFEGDGHIKGFLGSYSDYRDEKEERLKADKALENAQKTDTKKDSKLENSQERKKLSYKKKLEFENLEQEIETLEIQKKEFEKKINQGITDYAELEKTSAELGSIVQQIEAKTNRWMELAEYI